METTLASSRRSRLDPESFSGSDHVLLGHLHRAFNDCRRPALVNENGERIELPNALFRWMVQAVEQVRAGKAVFLIPENEQLTTQAAANMLGVSRPHLVKMLEAGELPFEKVGTHRRIRFGDVAAYMRKRSEQRRAALSKLTAAVESAGLYGD